MDTAFAETSIFAAVSRRRMPGQLWQVPTFCFGVVVLAIVWSVRPLHHPDSGREPEQGLAELRQALDKPLTTPDVLRTAAEPVASQLEQLGARRGEAHYLLGRMYIRQIAPYAGESAKPVWEQARAHLEQAERLGVAVPDRPRLLYLLATAWHHTDAEPEKVIAAMKGCVELPGNDRLEGYGMMAEAYLRLPKPDLKAALEVNQKQLSSPTVDDLLLVRPRLLRAELLLRMKEHEEARQVLRNLLDRSGPHAPVELLYKATLLLAESLHDEQDWTGALPLWEQLRADPHHAGGNMPRILYSLGLCYRQAGRNREAMTAWEQLRPYGGEYAQASALGLAELRLQSDNAAGAVEALAAAVQKVGGPADYHNTFLDLAAARAIFEGACQALLEGSAFEPARQVAQLYEKLAQPGQAQVLWARVTEAWAKELLEQAQPEGAGAGKLEEARTRFREAAAAFESAAQQAATPADQAEALWLSAQLFMQGHDPAAALRVLERCVAFPDASAEQLGEAWYAMAEAYQAQENTAATAAAYRECIKYPSPFAFKARYQIALAHMDKQEDEQAEEVLTQNLALMQSDADREAQEKSLCTLADLLLKRNNYAQAVVRLRQVLERYPENANALKRRFQLARCCQKLGDQEKKRMKIDEPVSPEAQSHYDRQAMQWWEEAVQNYLKIIDELAVRPADRSPTRDEEVLGRQANFAYAECRFSQQVYDDAFRVYESMAARYHHQVDGLVALWNLYHRFLYRNQPAKAWEAYQRLQVMVQEMDDKAFDGGAETRTRQWWEAWLLKTKEEFTKLHGPTTP